MRFTLHLHARPELNDMDRYTASALNRSNVRLAAAMSLILLWPGGISLAHHIRGIPHYTYSENYPTAPLFEDVRELDHFTLRMTYYEIPGSKAIDLALYVKDMRTDQPFDGDVTYAIYAANEDPSKAHSVIAYRNKNNIYKAGWEYEHDGVYWVRVTFDSEGQRFDEVFKLQMGNPRVNYWFIGACGFGVAILIVVVAVLKRASARKEAAIAGEKNE